MEHLLESFDAWFHSHGLKVNTGKTELIVFGSRQNCAAWIPSLFGFARIWFVRAPQWGTLADCSTSTSPGTLTCLPSSKNATVSSSGCPTCVTRSHGTYCQPWSAPWSSRKSAIVSPSMETGQTKTYNASKRSKILRCALCLAAENSTTYRTCGRNWAGLPPVSCTNSTP